MSDSPSLIAQLEHAALIGGFERTLLRDAAARIAELEGETVSWMNEQRRLLAERDRLLIAEEDAKLFILLHALAIEQGYMPDPGESAYDLLQRAIMTRSPRARPTP